MSRITESTIDTALTAAAVKVRNLDRRAAVISETKKAMAGKYVTKRLEPEFNKLPGLEKCRAHISQDSTWIYVHITPDADKYHDRIDYIPLCKVKERRVDADYLAECLNDIAKERSALVKSMEEFTVNVAILNNVIGYLKGIASSLLPVLRSSRELDSLATDVRSLSWF